jgi:hypothetical protein
VWMMGHRGAPGVEHRGEADLDAQVLGIGRNRAVPCPSHNSCIC